MTNTYQRGLVHNSDKKVEPLLLFLFSFLSEVMAKCSTIGKGQHLDWRPRVGTHDLKNKLHVPDFWWVHQTFEMELKFWFLHLDGVETQAMVARTSQRVLLSSFGTQESWRRGALPFFFPFMSRTAPSWGTWLRTLKEGKLSIDEKSKALGGK